MRYNHTLSTFGIRDHQVKSMSIGGFYALQILLYRLTRLVLILMISLPGVVLHAPIALLVSEIAEKKARGKTLV
jgi:glycerol-3-phosphate O-acyltransferase/dihydroxyacetone phosphate acyltransferase